MPALPPSKKPATPPSKATSSEDTAKEFTDSYGIVYLGDQAVLKVGVDVKLSRNYQSCGISAGMEFTTKAASVDVTLPKAFQKIRDSLRPQIEAASNLLNDL